jgi:hypothetical protein
MLTELNRHPRDQYIQFYEEGHRYDVTHPETGEVFHPTSTTTLIHKYFNDFEADTIIEKFFKPCDIDGKYYIMSADEIKKENPKEAKFILDTLKNKVYWVGSKYYNKKPEEIKEGWILNGISASSLGSHMHLTLEHYLDGENVVDDSIEFSYFLNFWKDFTQKYPQFKPYRLEWLIYDLGKRISGSIDCVLEDNHGNLILLDWKRSKEIKTSNRFQKGKGYWEKMDDCNYNHYTLQLNIYRHMLEKNYNRKVVFLMLVIFHPINPKGYKCIPVKMMDLNDFWNQLP